MSKKKPRPTDVELRILEVFWDQGPSTVRAAHNAIIANTDRMDTSYSTTLKMIQVLHAKGLLDRDASVRPQVFRATVTREAIQTHVVQDVAQRLFGGAMLELVQCAISSGKVSDADLKEMQRLIRDAKKGANKK